MIAETYFQKAAVNLQTSKILFKVASGDEEQLNIAGYHLQQALELAIKHVLAMNGAENIKTHDIDQLMIYAKNKNIDLLLSPFLIEHADKISSWESKTRYVMGFMIEVCFLEKAISAVEFYLDTLLQSDLV